MSDILSFIGWTFLPDLITSNLQAFYYNLTIRAGSPKPQPGSPTFIRHRIRIYVFVILAYLAYTIYEADWQIRREGDFYSDLGVSHDADDKAIQSRFRRLTLTHHPDKLPANTSPDVLATAQTYYIHLTTARDTLLSAPKRYAYDRLGSTITSPSWHSLKTPHDFILAGLKGLVPFYVASAIGLYVAGYLGFLNAGADDAYWRYWALATMGAMEVHTLTRPWHTGVTLAPTVLNPWVHAAATMPGLGWMEAWARRPYLPFQALRVAHRALVAFFIALGRLGPLLSRRAGAEGSGEEVVLRQLARLEQMVGVAGVEAARLLALEAVPFRSRAPRGPGEVGGVGGEGGRDEGLERLRGRVREWFVTNTIRQDPEVRQAVERVLEGRRGGAEGGEVPVSLRDGPGFVERS